MLFIAVVSLILGLILAVSVGVAWRDKEYGFGFSLLATAIIIILFGSVGFHTFSYDKAQIDAANNIWRVKLETKADGSKEWVRNKEATTQPVRE